MTYIFHVLVEPSSGSWKVRCPALESHGAISRGETKEEALAHIHNVLLMILLDMEAKRAKIPEDENILKGIPISVDTTAD
jgi:predicted RNase H-like HicB family nuclease